MLIWLLCSGAFRSFFQRDYANYHYDREYDRYAKSAFLSDEARAAHSALKAKYDPKGLLNPGKLA